MVTRGAKKISSFFIKKNIIESKDYEIYSYSFEVLLASIINLLVLTMLAIILGRIPETFVYLLAFLPLRILAGGYHADTHFRCTAILIITYLAVLLLLHYIPTNVQWIVATSAIITSFIIILIFAPVLDKNNPMTDIQARKLGIKSGITSFVYFIIILALVILGKEYFALILSLGTLSVAFSLIACKIKVHINS